jgi:predicted dienelactone hydrolase
MKTQRGYIVLSLAATIAILLSACGGAAPDSAPSQAAPSQAAPPTNPPSKPALIPTIPPATHTVAAPAATQALLLPAPSAGAFPLAEAGPYFPGRRRYTLQKSEALGGGEMMIAVWYPAEKPADFAGTLAQDAPADRSGAPYPLLLMSSLMGNEFAPHLASHGFVVAGVNDQGPQDKFGLYLIDYPREILLMLEQLASHPPAELAGVYDAENSGALGYSFSGHNTLFLGGARVDPQFYQAKCAEGPALGSSPVDNITIEQTYNYFCEMAPRWDEFAAHAGAEITTSQDGLWQPLSDERIRAIMPMAPDGPWEFGERGLAAITLPALMICGTDDSRDTDYVQSCVYTFEHLGSQEKGLISFVDQRHLMIFDKDPKARMEHFIVAFFGDHLQGKTEYREYYSADFVNQFSDLVYGVYKKP